MGIIKLKNIVLANMEPGQNIRNSIFYSSYNINLFDGNINNNYGI